MKYLVLTLFMLFPLMANSKTTFVEGNWQAYSRSDRAIYGSFTFHKGMVYWGVTTYDKKTPPPCSAKYTIKIVTEVEWIFSISNKKCNGDIKNSHISEKLEGMTFQARDNNEAWVSTDSGSGLYQFKATTFYSTIK
jgi:hypothetical protein